MAEHERDDVLLTAEVRELVALLKNTDIAEVLIERGDSKLHIKRALAQPAAPPTVAAVYSAVPPTAGQAFAPLAASTSVVTSDTSAAAAEAEQNLVTITAPMVGTYYNAPAPKEPPYVQPGDEVKPGDVLGIIEAMKIMNEIECEINGRVVRMMVENAQAVEYGQPLMLVEPF